MKDEKNPLDEAKKLEKQGKLQLAVEEYERVTNIGVDNQALVHAGKARILNRLGRQEETIEECQKALNLDPDTPLAYAVLGHVYLTQGKYTLAQEHLAQAVSLDPKDTISLINLGYVCGEQGWYDLTEECYLKALTLDSENIPVLENLAAIYDQTSRSAEADALLEKFVENQPDNLTGRLALASRYITQSKYRKASIQLNIVLRKRPIEWKAYLSYYWIMVHSIGSINKIVQYILWLAIYVVAIFAPLSVSIPVGIVFSIIILPMIFIALLSSRAKTQLSWTHRIVPLVWCGSYWFVVWAHYKTSLIPIPSQ